MRIKNTSAIATLVTLIQCQRPRLTRHEWGALALVAARQAGLEAVDVRALERNLLDQLASDAAEATPKASPSRRRSPRRLPAPEAQLRASR